MPLLKRLNLKSNQLKMKPLAQAFKHVSNLEELWLCNNNMDLHEVKHLSHGFQYLTSLKQLGIVNNHIGAQGFQTLAPQLKHMPHLNTLMVTGNDLHKGGLDALAVELKHLPQLNTMPLDLVVNDKGPSYLGTFSWDAIAPETTQSIAPFSANNGFERYGYAYSVSSLLMAISQGRGRDVVIISHLYIDDDPGYGQPQTYKELPTTPIWRCTDIFVTPELFKHLPALVHIFPNDYYRYIPSKSKLKFTQAASRGLLNQLRRAQGMYVEGNYTPVEIIPFTPMLDSITIRIDKQNISYLKHASMLRSLTIENIQTPGQVKTIGHMIENMPFLNTLEITVYKRTMLDITDVTRILIPHVRNSALRHIDIDRDKLSSLLLLRQVTTRRMYRNIDILLESLESMCEKWTNPLRYMMNSIDLNKITEITVELGCVKNGNTPLPPYFERSIEIAVHILAAFQHYDHALRLLAVIDECAMFKIAFQRPNKVQNILIRYTKHRSIATNPRKRNIWKLLKK